mmetsp:Transcript_51839/g.146090  ORF Transcript_51839/g.146090 Transcript_51839/m.146090 type:complete len:259 (-) Transcript_51839:151-927(-)
MPMRTSTSLKCLTSETSAMPFSHALPMIVVSASSTSWVPKRTALGWGTSNTSTPTTARFRDLTGTSPKKPSAGRMSGIDIKPPTCAFFRKPSGRLYDAPAKPVHVPASVKRMSHAALMFAACAPTNTSAASSLKTFTRAVALLPAASPIVNIPPTESLAAALELPKFDWSVPNCTLLRTHPFFFSPIFIFRLKSWAPPKFAFTLQPASLNSSCCLLRSKKVLSTLMPMFFAETPLVGWGLTKSVLRIPPYSRARGDLQ